MILRATFANIRSRALAERVQAAGLSGTITNSIGAGDWGIEYGATVEFATSDGPAKERIYAFVAATLRALGEQAAYVTVNGSEAFLRWQDGRVDAL